MTDDKEAAPLLLLSLLQALASRRQLRVTEVGQRVPAQSILSVEKKYLRKIAPCVPHGSKHGPDDDDDDDIYIMMKCLSVSVSRKIITSSWEFPVTT